jgi:hypothetical protein
MITKEQFTDELPFRYKAVRYTLNKDIGCIKDITGYVGNIESIGTKSFTIYTYVMGKQVKVKVNYEDCELIIEDKITQ